MASRRVERLARGELSRAELTAGERACEALARKSVRSPARLEPSDLDELCDLYGPAGALEVAVTACSFHFINRMAELVGIRSDMPLVRSKRTWGWRLAVRVQSLSMRLLMRLDNLSVPVVDVEPLLASVSAVRGFALPPGYAQLAASPGLVHWLGTACDMFPHVSAELLARVRRGVDEALPAALDDEPAFAPAPADPLEALVFVGTRYPARVTDGRVQAVRAAYGYDDAGLTDLFFAIGMMNCFARLDRLLRVSRAVPQPVLRQGLIEVNDRGAALAR